MKLLAIDTATDACSAALSIDGEIRERFEVAPRAHTELILPMIDELMAEAGLVIGQLDALAFGRGPGAFTGVRIAVGVAQGIAFAADLPVVPVSTLAALAQGAEADKVLAALDARMDEVYWGAYMRNGAGLMEAVGEEHVSAPEQVPLPPGDAWQGVGEGWAAYETALMQRCAGQVGAWDAKALPRARDVVRLGEAAAGDGRLLAAEQALPVYLRDKVTWKKVR
ncbi:MAG TPA: tRNA (adenosine(37)-N6)-threonylcarbamoyltransferase complex dimerization subunit type 1 TsaB [Gammaproteobacteria bacterium]|nr:tRNA (adenosine(37)-N6)-threonylcarbamoyltransferase complex dimerization subunit type 1 TsaB [Gammaproteobacteria bacterium]